MMILSYLLAFFLGAAVGSFVNVAVSRSIAGENWISGKSRCDVCAKELRWYDMVPVFSYLLYLGKSRCCHSQLSIRHPVVESMFGMLFVWWMTLGGVFFRLLDAPLNGIQPVFWLVTAIFLGSVIVTDYYYQLIPMAVVYSGIVITLLYRLILFSYGAYQSQDLLKALATAAGAYLFIRLLVIATKGKGMGEGDPSLAFWLAFILGWPKGLVALWIAFITGGVVGAGLLMSGRAKSKTPLPFGPFLAIGFLIALTAGELVWKWWWN